MLRFPLGTISTPATWDSHLQVTLVEPIDSRLTTPLAPGISSQKPRATLVIGRESTRVLVPKDALVRFVQRDVPGLPELRLLKQEEVSFDDGAVGASCSISFAATAALRVVQRHIMRIDDGVLTHLTATVEESRAEARDSELLGHMLSYRPS